MSTTRAVEELRQLTEAARSGNLTQLSSNAWREIDELTRPVPDPEWPDDLVARPCSLPAAVWHWQELQRLLDGEPVNEDWWIPRVGLHARWVLATLAPSEPDLWPLVSLIVPVFNRARYVVEALDSALAQSYRAIEIIVVDDGSTDDLDAALEPYRERIRLVRQPNRGVSSARNRGIPLARGEYFLFLDSDEVLDPGAIQRWVEACRCVGDAEICYSAVRRRPVPSVVPPFLRPPHGGPDCPTQDLIAVAAWRHPLAMSGTLVPRWLVLQVGNFDERLFRGEDTRFWFRIGLTRAKVIGLKTRLNESRQLKTGLTRSPRAQGEYARVAILNFTDLLEREELWEHLPGALHRVLRQDGLEWLASTDEGFVIEARERAVELLGRMPEQNASRGPGLRSLLEKMLELLEKDAELIADRPAGSALNARFTATLNDTLERVGAPG